MSHAEVLLSKRLGGKFDALIVSISEEMQSVVLNEKNIDDAIDTINQYAKNIAIDESQRTQLMKKVEDIDTFGKRRIEIMLLKGDIKSEERFTYEEQWQQSVDKLRTLANNCVLVGIYDDVPPTGFQR